jgi:hypothetical protein
MRHRFIGLLTNRVLIGMVVFFVLVGFWEFRWKPQYRPLYEVGIDHYQAGRYPQALEQFQRAYAIAPNSLDVILMLGWAHFKVNHFEEARFFFDRALRINPRTEEAQLGAAFVALETGRGTLDVDLIREHLGNRSGDPGVQTLSAGALAKVGRWFEAAAIYRGIANDREYGSAARLALADIFGLTGTSDTGPVAFPPFTRPDALDVRYWAGDGALWRLEGAEWRSFYVAGVNFGGVPPGYYPSLQPNDAADYGAWLDRAASLNANVIRVYSLLPPAFYRAFKKHATAGGPMTLFQQIWIAEPPGRDLFDSAFLEQTRATIRHVVDALNGRGEVPPGRGLRGGIYDQDVAAHVGAILLNRELEPSVVAQTNVLNAGERSHRGRYVQIADGTAAEVWVARMLDYLVEYETQTYNRQHPVAFVNWPPLDPLTHPTEASTFQELRHRMARGEQDLEMPSGPQDDADVVSLDEAKLTTTPAFVAGMFASYHVYPHWPDFLITEPGLLASRDSAGPNPVFGYIKQLAARIPHPLVITEYGVPNSMGTSHFHPQGWHHGGHDEAEQAAVVTRLARTFQEAGTAGGIVFSLHDEWYKQNWLVRRFEVPEDRGTLWLNDLNPDQRFGLMGFRTSKWRLFTRAPSAWENEPALYSAAPRRRQGANPFEGARTLRELKAAVDEAYLYVRLGVDCLDCSPKERRADGRPRFDMASYALTINTRPGAFGVQQLPFGGVSLPTGANFLLLLTDPPDARLLVSDNYNPYQIVPTPGIPSDTDVRFRLALDPTLGPRGSFAEVVVEPNRRRYTRDGQLVPPQRDNRSALRYGIDGAPGQDDTSIGEWYADLETAAILVRIPWGKLLVTDPSSHTVFAGYDGGRARTANTDAIEIAAFALTPAGEEARRGPEAWSVAASLPELRDGRLSGLARVTWPGWETVTPEVYAKKAYQELRSVFAAQAAPTSPRRVGRPNPARASSR